MASETKATLYTGPYQSSVGFLNPNSCSHSANFLMCCCVPGFSKASLTNGGLFNDILSLVLKLILS